MKHWYISALVALIWAAGATVGMAQPLHQGASLPADTVLKVRLDDPLDSGSSRPGDRFTATVEDPSFPSGTLVRGVVTDVKPADSQAHGRLAVDFRTLELPNGRRIPISGSPIALDSKSVRTTSSGRIVAKTHSSPNMAKYIGIGAAGGLAIGSLFGKNVIGGLLGAGAGYLIGKHHTKQAEPRNVVLKQGTEIGVRLDQRVVLAG
jgi:hypothetical protein